jgi:2,4-dienoyl-CoA reductase-like NADH-dependent reductase (Old Yellow Enzyme family)
MKLLTPLRIGPIEVKNRVVSTAHSAFLDFFQPGCDGEQYIAYQERRAEGGTGLIILTAMHVHKTSLCNAHFNYEPDDIRRKLGRLAERVHKHGAKVISQLFHFGAQGKSDCRPDLNPLWGFSGRISAFGEASHEMTGDEIKQVIQGFVDSAVIAVESGIDGVELHGTHGYLIQQSFSAWGNSRQDKWGEPLYFAKTLARRVREGIGPKAVLGLRISVDDFVDPQQGGLGAKGLRDVAAELIKTGCFDYLNHSEGAGNEHYARAIGSYRHRFGQYLPLTRGLKEAIGSAIPVIGVTKIPTPDLAEQALLDGDCDLVGMTRAQISDPDLVKKLETGQAHRIRTCTGANQGCIDRTGFYPITCVHNPEVGQEYKLKPIEKVVEPKKVLVIGGGPAGLKAAELAARRGHRVTLVEASHRLGGRINFTENDVNASNLLSSIAWLEQELGLLKVDIRTQTRVDEAFLRDFKPQAAILATGATPSAQLAIASDDSIPVIHSDDAAAGLFNGVKFDMAGTRSLFVDLRGNNETTLVVEMLVKRGSQVTVATPFLHFGANLGFTHLDDLLKSLPRQGCEMLGSTVLTAIADGKAILQHVYSGKNWSQEFDFVVAGVHPKPRKELHDVLAQYCPVILVGDVVAPRTALEAFREGDRAGRAV